jgi:hypothetical protein
LDINEMHAGANLDARQVHLRPVLSVRQWAKRKGAAEKYCQQVFHTPILLQQVQVSK